MGRPKAQLFIWWAPPNRLTSPPYLSIPCPPETLQGSGRTENSLTPSAPTLVARTHNRGGSEVRMWELEYPGSGPSLAGY